MSERQKLSVLLVEDLSSAQELITHYLSAVRRVRFEVTTADYLSRALELLNTPKKFDAVLLDLGLPDSQGIETLVKVHQQAPSLPIIVFTSHDDENLALESLQRGAQDYLVKDEVNSNLLRRAIRYAIERCETQREHWMDLERMRLVTQQLPAMLWSTDTNLKMTSSAGSGLFAINPGAHQWEELELSKYLGIDEKDDPLMIAHVQALNGESHSLDHDVGEYTFHVHVEPLKNSVDTIIGTLSVALDVSDHKRIQDELMAAHRVQSMLFPQKPPKLTKFDVAGRVLAAEETGGDYFDYIPMPNGKIAIVVSDVSGHGLGPALLMAEFRAYVRPLTRVHDDPRTILMTTNQFLVEDFSEYHFVTAFLSILDEETCEMRYAGAGHCGYLLKQDGTWERLDSTSMPLGLKKDAKFSTNEAMTLEEDELILIVTDGFQEASNVTDDLFTIERVLANVKANASLTSEEIIEALYAEVTQFSTPVRQRDDMTAVVIKRRTKS